MTRCEVPYSAGTGSAKVMERESMRPYQIEMSLDVSESQLCMCAVTGSDGCHAKSVVRKSQNIQ